MRIVWDGLINDRTSLGIVGLQTCRALRACGQEVFTTRWPGHDPVVEAEFPAWAGGEADAAIRFCDPRSVECLDAFPGARRRIAYCYFDFGTMDQPRVDLLNTGCWELWAVSPFTRQMLINAGVNIPIASVPHGVEAGPPPAARKELDTLTFVYVAQLGGPRKGTDILVDAFREAFGGSREARLVLKDTPQSPFQLDDPNIELISSELSRMELRALLADAHWFVAPARMESFGLLGLEAAAAGTPLIYPWHSAYASYANGMPHALPLLLGEWRIGQDGDRPALHWESSREELVRLFHWLAANELHRRIEPERVWQFTRDWTWEHTAQHVTQLLSLPRQSTGEEPGRKG